MSRLQPDARWERTNVRYGKATSNGGVAAYLALVEANGYFAPNSMNRINSYRSLCVFGAMTDMSFDLLHAVHFATL